MIKYVDSFRFCQYEVLTPFEECVLTSSNVGTTTCFQSPDRDDRYCILGLSNSNYSEIIILKITQSDQCLGCLSKHDTNIPQPQIEIQEGAGEGDATHAQSKTQRKHHPCAANIQCTHRERIFTNEANSD